MANSDVVYFDIAAVIVMLVSLGSFLLRRKTRTPANRVYLSALLLVLITAVIGLLAELYDVVYGLLHAQAFVEPAAPAPAARQALQLVYYALRSLTAPVYLVLIATVSDTTHRLNHKATRAFLWVPMLVVLAIILTNPLHHLAFVCKGGSVERGPAIVALYLSAAYYSVIGVWWLFRWRKVLSVDEFSTLMMQYPLVLMAVDIQHYFPRLHVEMFATSVALMMVAAFVIRPEYQTDSLVGAASLQAYNDMSNRAFITQKPLCLVYLEVVNMERLRELVGQNELQSIIRGVAAVLSQSLESGDILFYLRNGLFCISSVNLDPIHALGVAQAMHEQGKRRSVRGAAQQAAIQMRSCVVRAPQDVHDIKTLSTFVRRLGHLMPESGVATYEELSRKEDFALNMALSDCIARAIKERSFEVYYQPIFCVKENCFHSGEALVRLNDPTFGFVPPSLFIPEAEQSGAILGIGSILLEKICAFLGEIDYSATGLSYVEVNLSTEQCIRPQLAAELLDMLRLHSVDPSRVNFEITESSATFSQNVVESNVRALASAGATFSLDDYGTGYSNVSRALALPFDIVKLDKSFVDGMQDPDMRTVLAHTIAMMRQIGKKVLIEGVETVEQSEELCKMGADYLQGYLYARPMSQDEFVAFLKQNNA